MGCTCQTPAQYTGCAGAPPVFAESQVGIYADRVGAQGGTANWVRCYTVACLTINRLLYWHTRLGDCGQPVGAALSTSTKIEAQATSNLLGSVPIAGPLLQQLSQFLPWAHHAQAVATEQNTLCDVTNNWNGFCNAIEVAIQNGQIAVQDAIQRMQAISTQLQAEAQTVVNGKINSGYGVVMALKAMSLFNAEVVYPMLQPTVEQAAANSTVNSISQALGLSPSGLAATGAVSASGSTSMIAILAAIIGGAILIL
jgi:hypothetical protein